jgi:dTDP-4-dehydrorhamnose reductase
MWPGDLKPLDGCRILVTGADGMLGRAFAEALQAVRADVQLLDRARLDVTDQDAVMRHAGDGIDVILHCAGLSRADDCERHPDECRRVHVAGTRNIVALAKATGARVMYPQSVFIFDGAELPVTEQTTPAPLSAYGRCKLEAETLVLSDNRAPLVLRMAGFFGGDDKDKNFVGMFTKHLRQLRTRPHRRCEVGERVWQPTYTLDLAWNTLLLLAKERSGIYHMGAKGEATFFEVATACVQELGIEKLFDICPAAKPRWNDIAPRPQRMVTANRRLESEGLDRQRHWRDALRDYLARPWFDDLRGG